MAVQLVEVGPRDGLQNEARFIPTAVKLAWIERLADAGLTVIEATSFVSPKWVPQMADHCELMRQLKPKPGVRYPVLVPNERGLLQAIDCGATDIAVFVAASESFAQHNTAGSIAESFERLAPVAARAQQDGIRMRGYVSCLVHCPYEGAVEPGQVLQVAERLFELGCEEVSLGDTTGRARPDELEKTLSVLCGHLPVAQLAGHFHDTDGYALANIALAYDQFGIHTFDASTAGIGGCPYAPGAKGNVATEAVCGYFAGRGIATGIDYPRLLSAKDFIQHHLSF